MMRTGTARFLDLGHKISQEITLSVRGHGTAVCLRMTSLCRPSTKPYARNRNGAIGARERATTFQAERKTEKKNHP